MAEALGVLHLVNQLTVGGSERQMCTLIGALDRQRIRSSVGFMRAGSGELLEPLRALGTDPQEYSLRGSIAQWNTVTQVRRIAWRCRREGVAVIHAHDLWSNVMGVAAARLARLPVIISRRDMADFRPAMERRLLRWASRFADAVVANATAIRQLAIREGTPPGDIHVIPNGIDVAGFDARMNEPLQTPLPPRPASSKRIAVIGNMDRPHKGHHDVLVAAAKLREQPIDWLLVSDGPLRAQLQERAVHLGVADRVHFVGRRRDVAAVLARVDMLVHASSSEGFPNVVLEALCARLPVVATDVGATSDLIEDGKTGSLVAPGQPQVLAAAVAAFLASWQAAVDQGRAGRELVESCFAVDKTARRYEALYRAVAGVAASAGPELGRRAA